jgi:hypothetical protein
MSIFFGDDGGGLGSFFIFLAFLEGVLEKVCGETWMDGGKTW